MGTTMEVKGTAFLARKQMVVAQFGEQRWEAFLAELRQQDPYWQSLIMASTLIPIEKFLKLVDALVQTFADGDSRYFWTIGEAAADYALKDGPYKVFMENPNIQDFVLTAFPAIWNIYFTQGKLIPKIEGKTVDIAVVDLPVAHKYLEYTVMGFAKRALELLGCHDVITTKLIGLEQGKGEYQYRIIFH